MQERAERMGFRFRLDFGVATRGALPRLRGRPVGTVEGNRF